NVHVWDVDPVRPSDLLGTGALAAVGTDQPKPCAGLPSTNAAIRDIIDHAANQASFQQYADASKGLSEAADLLACLSEPAATALGGRLFLLQGVVAAGLGDADGEKVAFGRAVSFDKAVAWDERYPADVKAAFDAAHQATGADVDVVM